jgi:hypothetical protein
MIDEAEEGVLSLLSEARPRPVSNAAEMPSTDVKQP